MTLQDGRIFEGTVVNADLHSDIAIVKIYSKVPLSAAKLGSSSKLRPGDWVVAMGCPLSLQNTVTAGIVRYSDLISAMLRNSFSFFLYFVFFSQDFLSAMHFFFSHILFSCVDRKSSDLGLGGMRREYLQTDCAINAVRCLPVLVLSGSLCLIWHHFSKSSMHK